MELIDPAKVRALRKRKGYTMRDLDRVTAEAGERVPQSAISQIEAGRRQPREPKWLALADALGVDRDELRKAA